MATLGNKSFISFFPTLEEKKPEQTGTEIESGDPELTAVDEVQLISQIKEGKDLDDLVEIAEGGAAAQEQLNTLAGYVESAEKRGGMSSAMAQMTALTFECIVSGLGYTTKGKNPTTSKVVESLENFRNAETRLKSTQYTAETIKERAKEIGRKVIEAIKALIAKITNYVKERMKDSSQLSNAFNAIKKRLKGLSTAKKMGQMSSFKGFGSPAEVTSRLTELKAVIEQGKKLSQEAATKLTAGYESEEGSYGAVVGLFDQWEAFDKRAEDLASAIGREKGEVKAPDVAAMNALATEGLAIITSYNKELQAWDKYRAAFEKTIDAAKGSDAEGILRPRLRIQTQVYQALTSAVNGTLRKVASYCKSGITNLHGGAEAK